MSSLTQNIFLPFALFTSANLLMGCDQVSSPSSHIEKAEEVSAQAQDVTEQAADFVERSSGNMLHIVRDVADLQLKATGYVEDLQQAQADVQAALEAKNVAQFETAATALQQQLTGFNQALDSLNLKSEEIDQIRNNIKQANEQVLALPFLNGQIDLANVDLSKIQQQMGNVQNEMLQLAAMLLQTGNNEKSNEESHDGS